MSPLAATSRLPTDARAERFPAALLLIDITGFTSLTSSFTQRGPSGIEQLSRSINSYLGRMIDRVAQHGGDVIKIVGDAVLPIWRAENGDLRDATERATACGLEIATTLNDVEAEDGVRLSLKVGVCAGDVVAAQVGGLDEHWMFVVAGGAVSQLAAVQSEMRTGGVVLSPQAWTQLEGRAAAKRIERGHVVLVSAPPSIDPRPLQPILLDPAAERLVRAFVPIVCLQRLDAHATALSMPFEEGLVHYELGRHLEVVGDRAAHLDRARELFRTLGATSALAAMDVAIASGRPA